MNSFREFKDYQVTFIVMKQEGFGTMESPIKDISVVYVNEFVQQAEEYIRTHEDTEGWKAMRNPISYKLYTNTNTERGKELYEFWSKEFNKDLENVDPDNYETYTSPNGVTVQLLKNEMFDEWENGFIHNMDSAKVDVLDFGEKPKLKVAKGWRKLYKDGKLDSINGEVTLETVQKVMDEIYETIKKSKDREIKMLRFCADKNAWVNDQFLELCDNEECGSCKMMKGIIAEQAKKFKL